MSSRAAFAQIVYQDPAMQGLGFIEGRVWASNALDTPSPNTPFIIISSEGKEKAFGVVGVDLVTYWVHLPRNVVRDYGIIDLALDRIEELLLSAVHFVGEDGYVLSGASWVDRSRDLIDESFNTITKYSTFRAATRSVVVT
jgi:hypothetical protein